MIPLALILLAVGFVIIEQPALALAAIVALVLWDWSREKL